MINKIMKTQMDIIHGYVQFGPGTEDYPCKIKVMVRHGDITDYMSVSTIDGYTIQIPLDPVRKMIQKISEG